MSRANRSSLVPLLVDMLLGVMDAEPFEPQSSQVVVGYIAERNMTTAASQDPCPSTYGH